MPDSELSGELVLLVNPAARGGRSLRQLDAVVRRLQDAGRTVSVIVGTSASDALDRACTAVAEGPGALVAFGGDGMVHLAVQAVAGTEVPLGIIPAGTGNDIAAGFGLPHKDLLAAADVVARGKPRLFDIGKIADEWFAGNIACGFDARVVERANQMTRPSGRARYVVAMVQELRSFTPIPFRITVDDQVIEREAMLVAVGNIPSYGGGMRVCPAARPDDGLLDVMILSGLPKWEFVRIFPRVYGGTHVSHPAVTTLTAARVVIEAPGVVAYADGERVGPAPLTCTVEPGTLRVLTL